MLEKISNQSNLTAKDIMTQHPQTINQNELAVTALSKMRELSISQLVVKKEDKYLGMIHLHDLIKEGIM